MSGDHRRAVIALLCFLVAAIVLLVTALGIAYGQGVPALEPPPALDVKVVSEGVTLVEGKDWPHLVALLLGVLSVLPRRLSGTHTGTKIDGFWHTRWGVFALVAVPPVLVAVSQAIWTGGLHLMPVLVALVTALVAQVLPMPTMSTASTEGTK